jgi:hypothetical protein
MAGIKANGNVTFTIDGTSFQCDLGSINYNAEGQSLDSTQLCDTDATSIVGFKTHTIEMNGNWDVGVDTALAPKLGDGTKYTVVFAITDTVASQTVTYTWTAAANVGGEVSAYNRAVSTGELITYTATISISGSPGRVVA